MDAISVAIAVTVLSLGIILVYLFKSDHDQRQNFNLKSWITSSNTEKINKQQDGKSQVPKVTAPNATKKVPLLEYATSASSQDISPQLTASTLNITKLSLGKSNDHHQDIKVTAKQLQSSAKVVIKERDIDASPKVQIDSCAQKNNGFEPSSDELDSSTLLGVINSTNNNKSYTKLNTKSNSHLSGKKSSRKKNSSEHLNSDNSSDQLFNIIAASNLSKDEVELAVETLLNKNESGKSDWKPPRSDTLKRLKNQIRDSELALLTEIQSNEQTQVLLNELKSQLQSEKLTSKNEIVRLKKELEFGNLALEQARCDLSMQQKFQKQINDTSSQAISKLEQEKVQLQTTLTSSILSKDCELNELHSQLDEKIRQSKEYEMSIQTMSEKIKQFEGTLRDTELQLEQVRSKKQHDDCEASAKISELETDRIKMDNVLKDHVAKLKKASETNNLLENSLKELQLINNKQVDMLKRMSDERYANETLMKRTLCEMKQELEDLRGKLSANSASQDERLRKEISQVEKKLNNADEREQKLKSELEELREGLSALLPSDIKKSDLYARSDNWVHEYLAAVKQLAKTVDELRKQNNNNNDCIVESPNKKPIDNQSVLASRTNSGLSPTSKAKNHYDGEKKVMETKLLELNDYTAKLENKIQILEEEEKKYSSQKIDLDKYQRIIKELNMLRSKLEAQIKFGLDSLRVEQARSRNLEEELLKYTSNVPQPAQ